MTLDECITILAEHNKWRRGEGNYAYAGVPAPVTSRDLGVAMDYAVEELHRLKGLEK